MPGHTEEGELSDLELDLSLTDAEQALSEELNYRKTMRGIRSYMEWSHIQDVDSALSGAEDNPFVEPKQQPADKISVNLPTNKWLCRKMDILNLTLVQGYPSRRRTPEKSVYQTGQISSKVVLTAPQPG